MRVGAGCALSQHPTFELHGGVPGHALHMTPYQRSWRGHLPERRRELLPGETARKRLGIPMFLGEVQ
jgi:hypothetical protein